MMDEKDYIKLSDLAEASDSTYCDWEGFTGPDAMYEHIRWIRECVGDATDSELEPNNWTFADLTLHWVHANIDQGDYTPTKEETQSIFWAIQNLFGSNSYLKSGIDWKQPIEEIITELQNT